MNASSSKDLFRDQGSNYFYKNTFFQKEGEGVRDMKGGVTPLPELSFQLK
jgi:hypothetical protein